MQRQSDDVRNKNIALSADGRKLSAQSALTIENRTTSKLRAFNIFSIEFVLGQNIIPLLLITQNLDLGTK